jgi:hypothetical protein
MGLVTISYHNRSTMIKEGKKGDGPWKQRI